MEFKKDDIVIYPQHGACKVKGKKKHDFFGTGKKEEYLILETIINEMTLQVPMSKLDEVGVRPPVNAEELDDLVQVLSKPDPRVPSNWSRRFKNHQEKFTRARSYMVRSAADNEASRLRAAKLRTTSATW